MKMEIEVNGLINHHMESFLIDKIITCIIEFGVDRKDIRIIDGNAVRPDEDDDDEEV